MFLFLWKYCISLPAVYFWCGIKIDYFVLPYGCSIISFSCDFLCWLVRVIEDLIWVQYFLLGPKCVLWIIKIVELLDKMVHFTIVIEFTKSTKSFFPPFLVSFFRLFFFFCLFWSLVLRGVYDNLFFSFVAILYQKGNGKENNDLATTLNKFLDLGKQT